MTKYYVILEQNADNHKLEALPDNYPTRGVELEAGSIAEVKDRYPEAIAVLETAVYKKYIKHLKELHAEELDKERKRIKQDNLKLPWYKRLFRRDK